MKFCSHCGKEIMDEAVICPSCGCPISGLELNKSETNESASVGLVILSILIPIVGIILSIAYWNSKPKAARTYLTVGLIVIGAGLALYLFYVIVVLGIVGAIL